MQTTAENELRAMIGDLFMQLAMIRAEVHNLKQPPDPPKVTNGKEAPDADHRSEPG
jgi:hypothetical protein